MIQDRTVLPAAVLRNYLRAKDENRPHVLHATFVHDALLEIRNSSTAISFPALTRGLEGIADVLVRSFGQNNENVYSFYLGRPIGPVREFTCQWLVAMTEKATRAVRVGCGRYDWSFGDEPPHLAKSLVITISAMELLPVSNMAEVYAWITALSYPWSSVAEVLAAAPPLPGLQNILHHIGPA